MQAQLNIITTICGKDSAGYCCDGALAIYAKLHNPEQLDIDKQGNLYVADAFNHRIRKIELSTGIITTIGGTGTPGYNADNIPATDAHILVPNAVCADFLGNVYIADAGNYRIRKISGATGIITTIAGNGTIGSYGNGVPATNAQMNGPAALYADNSGNVYFADFNNNLVRKITASGMITTVVGTGVAGYSGDNGPATAAELFAPGDMYGDGHNNLIICDVYNHALRKVNLATGIITALAGNGTASYTGNGVPATNAGLNSPCGIYIDKADNIFFADYGNGSIRRIDGTTGIITTVAGMGVMGFAGDGGPATNAKMEPSDVCVDSFGTMYIADYTNHRIRKVYDPTLAVKPASVEGMISVYPNPASDVLTIVSASSLLTNATMTMYDVVGKVVMERKLNGAKETIDISSLNNGVYVVQIYDAVHNTRSMTKLVVAR